MMLFKEDTEKPVDIIQVETALNQLKKKKTKSTMNIYIYLLYHERSYVCLFFCTLTFSCCPFTTSILQARGMTHQIMDEFVSNNKFLQVPRLVNQQLFDELCPVKQFHQRRK